MSSGYGSQRRLKGDKELNGRARIGRNTWLTVGVVCLLTSACGSASSSVNQTTGSGPVNFGIMGGLTGQYAAVGNFWLNGATEAAKVINDSGGVFGYHVTIVPADDGYDPVDALTAVRKLMATGNIKVEVGLTAPDYPTALPILNQNHIVSFTYIGDPTIDNQVMPYSYSISPSDALEGAAMVVEAHNKGYTRVALAFDSTAQSLVPAAMKAASKLGLQVVANPAIPTGSLSYETVIRQIIDSNPDAVLMQIEPNQVGAFFNEWRALGALHYPIIASNAAIDSTWGSAAGADVTAHIVGVEALSTISGPGGSLFINTYDRLFHKTYGQFAAYAYDGTILAALAMTDAHSIDPTVYAPDVLDVTRVGPDHTACYTYATCVQLLKAGKKIKFYGVAGSFIYNQFHRPVADFASYSIPIGANAQPQQLAAIPASALAGLS